VVNNPGSTVIWCRGFLDPFHACAEAVLWNTPSLFAPQPFWFTFHSPLAILQFVRK
jgi:hypothetical protein